MAHTCPYCGNETGGADPCPWCEGSLGVAKVKNRVEPVIIHDDRPSNPWPWVATAFALLVIGVLLFEHRQTHENIVQMSSESGPDWVVNNHAPLFQSPGSSAPQLAHVASLHSNSVAPPPKPKATPDTKSDTEDTSADDQTDAVSSTTSAGPESVQLSNVQLASQDDGEGHAIAYGTATIYNSSPYTITEFQLFVATSGGTYRLSPYSGSVDNPQEISSGSISPGARVTIPVMSNGVISINDPNAAKTVTVEATENGSTVSSSVTVN